MATVVRAPDAYDDTYKISLFMGGSIDMGEAEDWQTRLEKDLDIFDDLILLNPRRDDWDSSWVQDPTSGTQFYKLGQRTCKRCIKLAKYTTRRDGLKVEE